MEKLVTRGSVQQLGMTSYDLTAGRCLQVTRHLPGCLANDTGQKLMEWCRRCLLGSQGVLHKKGSFPFLSNLYKKEKKCLQPHFDFRFSCRARHDLLTDFSAQDSQFVGSDRDHLAPIPKHFLHPERARLTRSLFLANMPTVMPGSVI